MPQEPSAEQLGGYVLCVGMPLQRVGEVARLLRGRAAVIATVDDDGARRLLGPPAVEQGSGPLVEPLVEMRPASRDAATEEIPVVPVRAVTSRPGRFVRGPLEVDLGARQISSGGRPIHLSMREFDLLVTLASEPDRVWSFAELTRTVWRTGYLGDPDPVVSAVKRLRKRLGTVPGLRLTSVRGVGYRLLVPA